MSRKIFQNPIVTLALVLLCLTVILPHSVFCGGVPPSVTGKNQLVQALNAAYVRVLGSGK